MKNNVKLDGGLASGGCARAAGHAALSAASAVAKTAAALASLYLFVCSLTFLSSSFRILGGKNLGSLFESKLIANPVVGVMIGKCFSMNTL